MVLIPLGRRTYIHTSMTLTSCTEFGSLYGKIKGWGGINGGGGKADTLSSDISFELIEADLALFLQL